MHICLTAHSITPGYTLRVHLMAKIQIISCHRMVAHVTRLSLRLQLCNNLAHKTTNVHRLVILGKLQFGQKVWISSRFFSFQHFLAMTSHDVTSAAHDLEVQAPFYHIYQQYQSKMTPEQSQFQKSNITKTVLTVKPDPLCHRLNSQL